MERRVAAAGRRRGLVHADHARARPGCRRSCRCPRGAVDRVHRLGGAAVRDRARARRVLNYAPLNFDLCLLDIWTTLGHGGCVVLVDQDRGTNGGYLADLLDRPRRERRAGRADALPAADRRRARGRPRLPGRALRAHDRRQDAGQLAAGAARACSRTRASSTSTAARRRTTASMHEVDLSGERPGAAARSASRSRASVALVVDADGGFVEGEGDGRAASSARRSRRTAT